jgi:hypothetical protein
MMLSLLMALTLTADAPDVAARESVAVLAGALSEENAEKFLAYLGPELRAAIEQDIRALLLRHEVTSSISPSSNEGDDKKRVLELDWYVEIRSKGSELPLERRRQNIRCVVEKNAKKRWVVTSLEPAGFFTPPAVP